jgi:hypothetical protein
MPDTKRLSFDRFSRVAECFHDCDHARCDEQLDRDSATGKLDFPFDEAGREGEEELLREWPRPR